MMTGLRKQVVAVGLPVVLALAPAPSLWALERGGAMEELLRAAGADPTRVVRQESGPGKGASEGLAQARLAELNNMLIEEIGRGNIDEVSELLKRGASPNAKGKGGWSALMLAAYLGHRDVAEVLLRAGAFVRSRNDSKNTALGSAASAGKVETVRLLLDWKAPVDQPGENGYTPLMRAVSHMTVLRLLIERGADPNFHAPEYGLTPLMRAGIEAGPEALSALLAGGARVDERSDDGRTALHWTAYSVYLDDSKGAEAISVLVGAGAAIDAQGAWGQTALMDAAYRSHLGRVRMLLAKGASVTLRDNLGRTALNLSGDDEVRRILLEAGAKP